MNGDDESEQVHGKGQEPEEGEASSFSNRVLKAMPRRRRKRPRPEITQTSKKPSTKTVPSLDDTALTFLDSNGDFLADRRAVLSSVPNHLAERQLGKWSGRQRSWQRQTLKNHVKKPLTGLPRRQWRSFALRSIPFTRLGTPPSDAVLALDRQGSFVLSLGSKDVRNAPLALALRFYGMHDSLCSVKRKLSVLVFGSQHLNFRRDILRNSKSLGSHGTAGRQGIKISKCSIVDDDDSSPSNDPSSLRNPRRVTRRGYFQLSTRYISRHDACQDSHVK